MVYRFLMADGDRLSALRYGLNWGLQTVGGGGIRHALVEGVDEIKIAAV
jgi:hypothetical protein